MVSLKIWSSNDCHNLYKRAYPFGLNLFFQPGLGPGFFLTLDSSGVFGLRLLLRIVPFRPLAEKFKRITPGLLTPSFQRRTLTPTSCLNTAQTAHHPTSPLFYSPPAHLQRWPCTHTHSYNYRRYTEFIKYIRRGCESIDGQKEANLSDRSLSAALSSGWAGGENASSGPEKSEDGT